MKKPFLFLIKISISAVVFSFLFYRIYSEIDTFKLAFDRYFENFGMLILVLLLMPLNWLMEVLKWKISIKPLTEITYLQASAGVFSGVSLGFVTPHAVGDYFAKIWSIKHQDRKKALGPILVTRISQMLPTLLFGLVAVRLFLKQYSFEIPFYTNYTSLALIVSGCLLLFLFLFLFLKYGKRKTNLLYYFDLVKSLNKQVIATLFGLSLLRYLIFALQFLLLLSVFSFSLSIADQFLGVAFMFLAKSILPTFNFFNDLGVREFSVVLYFEAFGIAAAPVILASLILWLINIALPAIIGLVFIQKFRFDLS